MPPKAKAKKMDLGAFLADDAGGSWNDDVDLPSAPASSFDPNALPTGPSQRDYSSGGMSGQGGFGGGNSAPRHQSSGPFDPSSVPHEGPFTAFIGNLSYDVTEHDLETFFGIEISIKSVRFIMDMATNKPKGYGYIEFMDRDSLIAAVRMDGESLQKRSVRLNVAEQKSRPGRPGAPDDSKFQGNWRAKAAEQPPRQHNPFGGNRREEGDRPHAGGWAAGFQRRDDSGFQRRDDSRPFQRREQRDHVAPPAAEPVKPRENRENPFGNAAPRDEEAIQRQLEERRLAREKERAAEEKERLDKQRAEKERVEKERVAAQDALKNAKISEKPGKAAAAPVPDNVPSGAGSWRRAQGAKPAGPQKSVFKRNSASEKGSVASIPSGDASESAGFTSSKFKKDGGKFNNNGKKEYVRKDKDGPSPTASSTKSEVKSPKNAFELLEQED